MPFITDVNKAQVENAIFSAMDFVKMRVRKRKAEEESYKIAKEAAFSWKTATKYMKNGVFDDEDDLDDDIPWWEKPEPTKEKKMEKMRAAERDVKFEIANKKKLAQQPFRNRFRSDQQGLGGGVSGGVGARLPYSKSGPRRCHHCLGYGHIQRFCPQRFQAQPYQNIPQQMQQLQLGQSKARPAGNGFNTGN